MLSHVSAALLLVIVATSAVARSFPTTFKLRSPDGRFEAVCNSSETPIFRIIERQGGRVTIPFEEESTSNRGMEAAWAPDSKTLAVLMEWRLYNQVLICRLRGDSFTCTEAPSPPELHVSLAGWRSARQLQLKGDRRLHTLLVTPGSQSYVR